MTLDDVRRAALALAEAGTAPSANKILAHLGVGSKKTVLKYLRQLADAGEVFVPVPVPEPVPPEPEAGASQHDTVTLPPARLETAPEDPVYHRQPPPAPQTPRPQTPVAQAEDALRAARQALVQAKLTVLGARDLLVDGFVRGALDRDDDFPAEALAAVDAAKRHYDACVQALSEAQELAQQQAEAQRKAAQRAWVAEHHPQVVTALAQARATYETLKRRPADPGTPSAFSTASYVRQRAQDAYNQALQLAPIHPNGTHPDEKE